MRQEIGVTAHGVGTGIGRRGVIAGAAALAGCQQPIAPQADVTPRLGPNRIGYIALQAPIINEVRNAFIGQVSRLLALDAAEIYLLMASLGGVVNAAQDMIAFMDQTHASRGTTFTTYNAGVVASAACYVFLAGQRRLSVPRGQFLFHEAALVSNGAITSLALQDASIKMQQIERSFLTMLTTRTKLTEAEASSFVRRTVILNADEARRDGIIQATADFTLPPGATAFGIRAVSAGTAPVRRPETGGGG
jgi:ATP-dependent protease ClpP protease subunit